jgi:apolipoprotein D and lipocalin family protein
MVEAARYAGTWYELARLPNRFQEQCKGDVTAVYEARTDGTLGVVNSCRTVGGDLTTARGRATQESGSDTGARWKVSFLPSWLQWFPLGRGDYWIVMLDADYRYAVVSEPSREYMWILSRTPSIDAANYDALLSRLQAAGYPVGQLVRTPQAAGAAANPATSSVARLNRML